VHLDCNGFTSGRTRPRAANCAHDSTSSPHDACASADLAWHAPGATGAWIIARGDAPGSLLDCSRRRVGCVAYSVRFHAQPAIASVAWDRASVVSRDGSSVLVAGSPATAKQLEMARIVHPSVSVSCHLAVRHSFRVLGLLRPGSLPGVLVLPQLVWLFCSGRPAMRRGVDVDLRHGRLLHRRCNFRCALAFAASIGE
jgi:hypothetical protein